MKKVMRTSFGRLFAVLPIALFVAVVLLTGVQTTSADASTVIRPFWQESTKSASRYSYGQRKSYRKGRYSKRRAYKRRSDKRRRYYGKRRSNSRKRSYSRRRSSGSSYSSYSPTRSLTGKKVRWVASSGCLAGRLKAIVNQVAANYGPVTVNSTCRSKRRNRAVGGARRSKHLSGNAVDFRVRGNVRAVYAFLRRSGSVGGLKHYGGGLFHIDTGPRRTW